MAGRAVGAEAGEDMPGGKGSELAERPDPQAEQQISQLDALEDGDGPGGEESGRPSGWHDEWPFCSPGGEDRCKEPVRHSHPRLRAWHLAFHHAGNLFTQRQVPAEISRRAAA